MKIDREKNLVEFTPESDAETKSLQSLWNLMVDCVKFNKKLVPVGEYIPSKRNLARFMVEGEIDEQAPVYVPEDTTVYCATCNKYFLVKKGQQVPLCCGKTMESLD